ncbi:MAG TPA: FlgD immunoglobulin-like domain containing protein [Candidatus Kapabacteria bacterium]
MVTRAQTADSLVLHLKTGKIVPLPISRIQKITFESKSKTVPKGNEQGSTFAVSQNYPNPVKSGTYFPVDINVGGDITINIFDVNGKSVRKLSALSLPAGKNEIWWDGLDGNGSKVVVGSYLYEVACKNQILSKKLIILKY